MCSQAEIEGQVHHSITTITEERNLSTWVWALPLACAKLGGGASVSYHHHFLIIIFYLSLILSYFVINTSILHHVLLLLFIVFLINLTLCGAILMPFLS